MAGFSFEPSVSHTMCTLVSIWLLSLSIGFVSCRVWHEFILTATLYTIVSVSLVLPIPPGFQAGAVVDCAAFPNLVHVW